jgi:hypothetical protein
MYVCLAMLLPYWRASVLVFQHCRSFKKLVDDGDDGDDVT